MENKLLITNQEKTKYDLTEEEIKKAKENGFILLGKTGTGKTTLLNLIYGDNIGKIGYESKSETNISSFFCIKKEINSKKFYFSIIDTPGLYDSHGLQNDIIMKDNTKNLISKENIKIKGILFLSNFHNERFDYSEIDSLFQYNAFFPLKNFWEHIILIFTHYYGDPDGDSKEEIMEKSKENFSKIFSEIMERIKEVSTPVKFIQLEKLYVNIHSKVKNEKHLKINETYKNQILQKIYKYTQFEPMYNRYCLLKFLGLEVKMYKEYLFNVQLELFLDEKNKIINKIFKMLEIKSNKKSEEKNQVEMQLEGCETDKKGNLRHKIIIKKGPLKDFKLVIVRGGFFLISVVGGLVLSPFIGICGTIGMIGLGTTVIIYDVVETIKNKKSNEKEKEEIKKVLNIEQLIESEIIEYMKNKNNIS